MDDIPFYIRQKIMYGFFDGLYLVLDIKGAPIIEVDFFITKDSNSFGFDDS